MVWRSQKTRALKSCCFAVLCMHGPMKDFVHGGVTSLVTAPWHYVTTGMDAFEAAAERMR